MVDGLRNLPAVAFSFYYCYYKLSALSVAFFFSLCAGKFVHCMRLFVVVRSAAAATTEKFVYNFECSGKSSSNSNSNSNNHRR